MTQNICITPLNAKDFAPFGDILDASGDPDKLINRGLCARHHDKARLEFDGGRAGISIFNAEPRTLPLTLDMVERHPNGSQAFIPMSSNPFVIVVAPDENQKPSHPLAFMASSNQGVNLYKGVWHGVLTPLHTPDPSTSGLFAVIDRIGDGPNLEEHWFDLPYLITL